jgi:hypothetical protein
MTKLLPFFTLTMLVAGPFFGRTDEPTADNESATTPAANLAQGPNVLKVVPDGYHLQAFDDCGIAEREPHVLMKDSYFFTFATSDTDAEIKSRSAVFNRNAVAMLFKDLDP